MFSDKKKLTKQTDWFLCGQPDYHETWSQSHTTTHEIFKLYHDGTMQIFVLGVKT
jgi:hypothetical protein